jgi:hypothetical protein
MKTLTTGRWWCCRYPREGAARCQAGFGLQFRNCGPLQGMGGWPGCSSCPVARCPLPVARRVDGGRPEDRAMDPWHTCEMPRMRLISAGLLASSVLSQYGLEVACPYHRALLPGNAGHVATGTLH